jgi:hypothetical protein
VLSVDLSEYPVKVCCPGLRDVWAVLGTSERVICQEDLRGVVIMHPQKIIRFTAFVRLPTVSNLRERDDPRDGRLAHLRGTREYNETVLSQDAQGHVVRLGRDKYVGELRGVLEGETAALEKVSVDRRPQEGLQVAQPQDLGIGESHIRSVIQYRTDVVAI